MSKLNQKITALRKAAIDAAVELDWTKNEPGVQPEIRQRAASIIQRVFDACEALDTIQGVAALPDPATPVKKATGISYPAPGVTRHLMT
jgi:hypothetical protein